MEHTELEEKVYALVAQAAPAKVAGLTLALTLSLRRDLGLDSLGLATLLFNLGEELGVDPNDLIETIADTPVNTVADLMALGAKVTSGALEGSRA
jgi:acyl carrier protein